MSKSIALNLIPTIPLDKPNPRIDMLVHTYLSGTMIESVKSDTNLTPQQKELIKTSIKQFNLTDVDFMVDIETLGKEQDGFAPIVSIGLVPFTKDMVLSKLGIESKIDLTQYDDPKRMKGIKPHSSVDTISWWLKQSKEAQKEFIGGDSDLKQTLVVMKQLIDEFKNCMGEYEPQIYAKSHDFDVTLLERWGRGLLEVSDFKFVKYYNSRCVRTVKSEALKRVKNKEDFNKYFPKPSGTKHSAFDDVLSQVQQVQYCWKYVDDFSKNENDKVFINYGFGTGREIDYDDENSNEPTIETHSYDFITQGTYRDIYMIKRDGTIMFQKIGNDVNFIDECYRISVLKEFFGDKPITNNYKIS